MTMMLLLTAMRMITAWALLSRIWSNPIAAASLTASIHQMFFDHSHKQWQSLTGTTFSTPRWTAP